MNVQNKSLLGQIENGIQHQYSTMKKKIKQRLKYNMQARITYNSRVKVFLGNISHTRITEGASTSSIHECMQLQACQHCRNAIAVKRADSDIHVIAFFFCNE